MTSTARDTGVSPSSFNVFDFVIVGGGLSGLVVAARLSENPNISVGVLESGPWKPDDPQISTPYYIIHMFGNPEYQSATETLPQKHLGGKRLICPRGRVLGGGSSVNFLLWHRGSKRDYDSWELLGNPGWNFETIARAGKKSETYHPPDTEDQLAISSTDAAFHGTHGPVQTSFCGWIPESQKAFHDVMEKFGLAKNKEWYNGHNTGIRSSVSSLDPKTGTRSSAATAYYEPNASRPNLSVLCGAHVTKIELEKNGDLQVARGVHYRANERNYFVKARKEVIISAGSLDSPQLLELSGIGDPRILSPLGIDVRVDNPNVGSNLQDHMMVWMMYLTKPGHHTQDALKEPEFAKAAAELYAAPSSTQAHGPLAGTFHTAFYVPVKQVVPEIELQTMKKKLREETLPFADNEGIRLQLDYLDDPDRGTMEWVYIPRYLPTPTSPEPGRSYIGLMAAIQHPFSRGDTHIISADPMVQPAIDPHYMEISWDKSLLVHGLQQIDKASRTEPLASLIDRRYDPAPGDDSYKVFEKYAVDALVPGIHWVGSASMLPREKGGVVDTRCKVYGTANLRVIDASIIPLQISAHIQATLYAVAERAAELIIEDHKDS